MDKRNARGPVVSKLLNKRWKGAPAERPCVHDDVELCAMGKSVREKLRDGASTPGTAAIDPARVIMIGDSLHTDIAGAARLGMDSAFIPGGIHGEELKIGWGEVPDGTVLTELFARDGVRPTFVLPAFSW